MKSLYAIFLRSAGICGLLLLCACGSLWGSQSTTVVHSSAASIHNLQLGRQYVAEGRYELAREHYLFALAASDEMNKDVIAQELHAVDLMVKTQR